MRHSEPMTSPASTGPAAPTDHHPLHAGRCFGDGDALYAAYHDHEWAVPVHGEAALFERLALEAFQSGLSWLTVLRKREAFRDVFAGFDPEVVAAFGPDDVARLLEDARIIRNRRKIEATIANARTLVALHERGGTLDELVWSFAPDRALDPAPAVGAADDPDAVGSTRRPVTWADVPASTPASLALSKALKREGFVFVGPVTMYATMQACGLVDDHLVTCPVVTGRWDTTSPDTTSPDTAATDSAGTDSAGTRSAGTDTAPEV